MIEPVVDENRVLEREQRLLAALTGLDRCLVAFSGGVDSTYLAWAARRALGGRALAVTAVSASVAASQRREARRLAGQIGIRLVWIETREDADPRYLANDRERCYWCKSELFQRLQAKLPELAPGGTVVDGTNRDDLGDIRPGRRAARELGVRSPLAEAGLGKAEVRWLSRRAGLPTWNRPASPCLASRIPYGSPVDKTKLAAIERAEEAVRALGFREFRVRHHGAVARIELAADELRRALDPELAGRLAAAVRAAGFEFVALDLEPFRSGRLNEACPEDGSATGRAAAGAAGMT